MKPKIGYLVVDNHGRPGIVMGRIPFEALPEENWLTQQSDPAMRECLGTYEECWLEVMPLSGGSIMVPAGLLREICGPVSKVDFAEAWKNANGFARDVLEMLP